MPSSALNNLGVNTGWSVGESGWKAGVDNNWALLDALVQTNVLSASTTAPPGSPATGDRYVVPASASGAWSGHTNKFAIYTGAAWVLVTPLEGWTTYVRDTDETLLFDGTNWQLQHRALTITDAGTARTLALTDEGKWLRFTSSSAVTVTVPLNATVPFKIGARVTHRRAGTGTLTLSPTGGVTLNSDSGLAVSAQHGEISLVKVGTNEWDVY
jgi:hypothetical protein